MHTQIHELARKHRTTKPTAQNAVGKQNIRKTVKVTTPSADHAARQKNTVISAATRTKAELTRIAD